MAQYISLFIGVYIEIKIKINNKNAALVLSMPLRTITSRNKRLDRHSKPIIISRINLTRV